MTIIECRSRSFQFRSQSYRQAFFAFNGAILASMMRNPGTENCGDIMDIVFADQNESKPDNPIPSSAIYLELKTRQVI